MKIRLTLVYEREEGNPAMIPVCQESVDDFDAQFLAEYFGVGYEVPKEKSVVVIRDE